MNNTLLKNIITANKISVTGVSVMLQLLQQNEHKYIGKQLGLANDIGVTRQALNIAIQKLVKEGIVEKIKENKKCIGIRLRGGIE